MRIEKVLTSMTTLTREQRYFLACWFNMVHEHSLDSYRVRVMNPVTVLREIERILIQGNEHDKLAVFGEAHVLLSSDPVLKAASFEAPTQRFLELLKNKKLAESKPDESKIRMFRYFLAELRTTVESSYVEIAFNQLDDILLGDALAAMHEAKRFSELHLLCGSLLSASLDRGFCLESLFKIYWQVLVPRRVKPTYVFKRKFWLARQLLTQAKKTFRVVLAIDQVTKPADLPARIAKVDFSAEPPFVLQARHAKATYLDPVATRVFASVEVDACDARAAGAVAFEQVNDLVNLLRFEYEHARLQMPDRFAFVEKDKEGGGARVYPIPMLVPNPAATLDGVAVAEFVRSVEDLMAVAPFSNEGRDRIYSAFRLYRLGRDTDVPESKLLNWWTAVEYLARGTQASGNIGSSVEALLTPVLCLSYLTKLLTATRNVLVECGVTLVDVEGLPIALRGLGLQELHALFSQPVIQQQASAALVSYPYVQEQVGLLVADLLSPATFATRLKAHEQRVRWQLGRIYRTRCDIVHSAGRNSNTSLLCSNLEYYLKTVLHALLRGVREVPTLSGPREFFDRQCFVYERVQAELAAGRIGALRNTLSA